MTISPYDGALNISHRTVSGKESQAVMDQKDQTADCYFMRGILPFVLIPRKFFFIVECWTVFFLSATFFVMDSVSSTSYSQTMAIPAASRQNVAPSNANRAPDAGNRERRVLVVDDEPALQMLLQLQLNLLGCDTAVASNGEEALALFAAAKNENRPSPFALVLMDLVMPGIDGVTACKSIRNLYPAQNLVIVSGYAPVAQVRAAAQMDISWIIKPYTFEEISEVTQAAIRQETTAASPANAAET